MNKTTHVLLAIIAVSMVVTAVGVMHVQYYLERVVSEIGLITYP
jgi:hypothetical protein